MGKAVSRFNILHLLQRKYRLQVSKINLTKKKYPGYEIDELPVYDQHRDREYFSKRVQEERTDDKDGRSKNENIKIENSKIDNLHVGDENVTHNITYNLNNVNYICQTDERQNDPQDCQTPRNVREDDSSNLAQSQEQKLQEKPELYNRKDKQELSKQSQSNDQQQLAQQEDERQTSQFHAQPQHQVHPKLFLHNEKVGDNQSMLHGDITYNISELKSLQVGDNQCSISPQNTHIHNHFYPTFLTKNELQGFQQTNEQPENQSETEIEQDIPKYINHDKCNMTPYLEVGTKIDFPLYETDDSAFKVGETFAVHIKNPLNISINKQHVISQEILDKQYSTFCSGYIDMPCHKKLSSSSKSEWKCFDANDSQSRQKFQKCHDLPLQRSRFDKSLGYDKSSKSTGTVRKIKQILKFQTKSETGQQKSNLYKKKRATTMPIEYIPLRNLNISIQSPTESDFSLVSNENLSYRETAL